MRSPVEESLIPIWVKIETQDNGDGTFTARIPYQVIGTLANTNDSKEVAMNIAAKEASVKLGSRK